MGHGWALELASGDDSTLYNSKMCSNRLLEKGPSPGFSFLEPASIVAQNKRLELPLGPSGGACPVAPAPLVLPEVLEGQVLARSEPTRLLLARVRVEYVLVEAIFDFIPLMAVGPLDGCVRRGRLIWV